MIKRKKNLSLLIVSALLLSTQTPSVKAAEVNEPSSNITQTSENYSDSSVVNIKDKYLKSAVLKALKKDKYYTITVSDMKSLTKLDVNSDYIEDISPLQYCTNLESLAVYVPADSDLSVLSNLTKLTELRVITKKHQDYSPLANLKNLKSFTLQCYSNYVASADLSFLSELNNLTLLNLCGNIAYNLDQISSLTNLTSLTLSAPNTDISPLENLVNLKTLNLAQCENPNLLPLAKLTNLETLAITSCDVSDIKALNSLTNLKSLNLNSNAIYDLSQISSILKTLTNFSADFQRIEFANNEYFDRFKTENIVRDELSKAIQPIRISNSGSYVKSSNDVAWNTLVGTDRVSYEFSKYIEGTKDIPTYSYSYTRPGKFSGTIVYKLTEKEPENDSIVSIKDGTLYSSIIEALNKEYGYSVTKEDLQTITELNCKNRPNIKDISPLKYCTNLKHLYIYLDKGANVKDLSNLTNLTDLSLSIPTNTDLSSLSTLINLETLKISGSDYHGNYRNTDISFLSSLTNLTKLDLSYNNIIDISALSNLTKLTSLSLDEQVSDITPLTALKNLESLKLYSDGKITDITSLSDLTNLKTLFISGCNLSDITPLAALNILETLRLTSSGVNDISPLISLTNLKMLSLYGNAVSDVSPLSNLTTLNTLDLDKNAITDISPLKNLFKTLERFSAESQVIKGGSAEYYDRFSAPNIIYDEYSNLIVPKEVSNSGYYNKETKTVCWDRLCGVKKVYYRFSKTIDDCKTIADNINEYEIDSSKFSGYVEYSLTETF